MTGGFHSWHLQNQLRNQLQNQFQQNQLRSSSIKGHPAMGDFFYAFKTRQRIRYNHLMHLKRILTHSGFIILTWAIFAFFMVVILPTVSNQANQMGLTPSIDTNFSFDPNQIYAILDGYGEQGRRFYLYQRWTFDLIWPMVYGFPIFLSLKRGLRTMKQPSQRMLVYLPLVAMGLDYLENITYSFMVIMFPFESIFLAYLGVGFSFLKWISLSSSLFIVITVGLIGLTKVIFKVKKSH
jgi:hypothetical protein